MQSLDRLKREKLLISKALFQRVGNNPARLQAAHKGRNIVRNIYVQVDPLAIIHIGISASKLNYQSEISNSIVKYICIHGRKLIIRKCVIDQLDTGITTGDWIRRGVLDSPTWLQRSHESCFDKNYITTELQRKITTNAAFHHQAGIVCQLHN